MNSNDWKPIESAPRDGSRFLVFEPFEPTVEMAWFDSEDEMIVPSSIERGYFWKVPTHWIELVYP